MKEVVHHRGTNTTRDFSANKVSFTKPEIKKEYFDKDGQRMYKTVDGRTFIADVFDKTFNQGIKLKMKPKNFKAKSIDPRMIY
jgi:hypothetical protein